MDERNFRLVFFSVFVLTLLSLAAVVVLALTSDTLSAPKQQLFNSLLALFVLGAGAIIGLVGSNAGRGNKDPNRDDKVG